MNSGNLSQIENAIGYVNQFRGKTFLIKLGGAILENDESFENICADLKLLIQAGIHIVIVHGGSKAINQTLNVHQIESKFVDGLRVTSLDAIKIIEMVLCGHINKRFVRQLNYIGIHAAGLAGSDLNMLMSDPYSPEHGYVGVIKNVNVDPIDQLMGAKSSQGSVVPIIAPIGVNDMGKPMNINADHAACKLAIALGVDKLIYLTDQEGIYDKKGCLLSEVTVDDLKELIINQTVDGGMYIKCKAIMEVLNGHLNHAHILNGNHKHVLLKELFTVKGVGTLCTTLAKQKQEAVI